LGLGLDLVRPNLIFYDDKDDISLTMRFKFIQPLNTEYNLQNPQNQVSAEHMYQQDFISGKKNKENCTEHPVSVIVICNLALQ
jgi:hypothetical protein